MKNKLNVSVYQHPTFEEGEILFEEDMFSRLLEQCECLYQKEKSGSPYPREDVERRFAQLFQVVSLEKSLKVIITSADFNWQDLLEQLKESYPQLVWTLGRKSGTVTREYTFEFIPIVIQQTGFPFGTTLSDSLIQQGLTDNQEIISNWEEKIHLIIEDLLKTAESLEAVSTDQEEQALAQSSHKKDDVLKTSRTEFSQVEKQESSSTEELKESDELDVLIKEIQDEWEMYESEGEKETSNDNQQLIDEHEQLKQATNQLKVELESLQVAKKNLQEANKQLEINADLNKQAEYYESIIRHERVSKEEITLAKTKLEELVSHLEREVTNSRLIVNQHDIPYIKRKANWYKRKRMKVSDYDKLYQKARYLEHTWQINQRLLVISERLTIDEHEMKYEWERINSLRHSTKGMELFVMRDTCSTINQRVKVRKGFLLFKPKVTLTNADYDNLVGKASYFDVIQSENQILEKIIEEHSEVAEADLIIA